MIANHEIADTVEMKPEQKIAKYPALPSQEITPTKKQLFSVDATAESLRVQRRRIYDVINVLESMQIASRSQDGHYSWNGLGALDATLGGLKCRFAPTNSAPQSSVPSEVGVSYHLDIHQAIGIDAYDSEAMLHIWRVFSE